MNVTIKFDINSLSSLSRNAWLNQKVWWTDGWTDERTDKPRGTSPFLLPPHQLHCWRTMKALNNKDCLHTLEKILNMKHGHSTFITRVDLSILQCHLIIINFCNSSTDHEYRILKYTGWEQNKLDQLERLRSEIPPAAPWLPIPIKWNPSTINSLRLSDIQIMTWQLVGAKPSSEPILQYYPFLRINFSEILNEIQTFSFEKML